MTETEQSTSDVRQHLIEEMRVLMVAGIPVGVLVAGVGSRLAMLLLRFTSPDRVIVVISDDGFTIGQLTLGFPGLDDSMSERIRPLKERSARNIKRLIESETSLTQSSC